MKYTMPPEAVPPSPPFPAFDHGPALASPLPRPSLGDWARQALVPVLLLAAFLVPPPTTHSGPLMGMPSFCLFYRITGLPCPGCGLTRSCVCFAHGRWAESLQFHPLGPLTFLVLALILLFRVPVFRRFVARMPQNGAALSAYGATGLFLAVWAARLLHFLPSPPGL